MLLPQRNHVNTEYSYRKRMVFLFTEVSCRIFSAFTYNRTDRTQTSPPPKNLYNQILSSVDKIVELSVVFRLGITALFLTDFIIKSRWFFAKIDSFRGISFACNAFFFRWMVSWKLFDYYGLHKWFLIMYKLLYNFQWPLDT